ncbi:hypothetical protein OF83DRAFT_1170792 [Amylostereum chailletii]|nr:hypothetical protein OF83DRAFT_1170792 [Amylostereum chailletii]
MTSFTFNFDLEDDLDESFDEFSSSPAIAPATTDGQETPQEPFAELPLSELLDALPDDISYSHIAIPRSGGKPPLNLVRRDLFDARFQVIAREGGTAGGDEALEFLEAPSDLVPRKYEGGLKTWECSLDLAGYLAGLMGDEGGAWIRGKRVLELGCGTAVPSLLLFQQLLASPPDDRGPRTSFHLQDYNRSVFELITLPNLVLTWYLSPLSTTFRASQTASNSDRPAVVGEETDPHLSLTPEAVAAFRTSLDDAKIDLRFFVGSWEGFDVSAILGRSAGGISRTYDVVLTSETIYRTESVPALLRVLHDAVAAEPSVGAADDDALADRTAKLSLESGRVCLVAAKVLYFGVGGGVEEFVRAVQTTAGGKVETVWEKRDGVGRRIMRLAWA